MLQAWLKHHKCLSCRRLTATLALTRCGPCQAAAGCPGTESHPANVHCLTVAGPEPLNYIVGPSAL